MAAPLVDICVRPLAMCVSGGKDFLKKCVTAHTRLSEPIHFICPNSFEKMAPSCTALVSSHQMHLLRRGRGKAVGDVESSMLMEVMFLQFLLKVVSTCRERPLSKS